MKISAKNINIFDVEHTGRISSFVVRTKKLHLNTSSIEKLAEKETMGSHVLSGIQQKTFFSKWLSNEVLSSLHFSASRRCFRLQIIDKIDNIPLVDRYADTQAEYADFNPKIVCLHVHTLAHHITAKLNVSWNDIRFFTLVRTLRKLRLCQKMSTNFSSRTLSLRELGIAEMK